ncbi:hypothetical protein G7Z17_g5232 [Cylindrodendrum hubeiense]|uniref:Uncharacterized protein n=1 Tax=Cylindrodendrum hubeiense TaxID=595255 RepID=A0A9P5LI14_9HYPO|nr:hypothetical protein G7Z17_g5232 [Cylindrodendrum hubeiense]
MTYSLLKTTKVNTTIGYDGEHLQLVIYECLALTTAYPVALLQQMRGNTCEPAITKYCHETAAALQHLRLGGSSDDKLNCRRKAWSTLPLHFVPVDYFFEIFSLQLEREFQRQPMRSKVPSVGPQHIIYCIRNHFENLVDGGNLDERRAPIILQNCDWIINSPRNTGGNIMIPTAMTLVAIFGISAMSATILTLLQELWNMWDPFGKGINTFAWTLGIAREIDDMLNEYDEYDENSLIRVHSYMQPGFMGSMGPVQEEFQEDFVEDFQHRSTRVQSV